MQTEERPPTLALPEYARGVRERPVSEPATGSTRVRAVGLWSVARVSLVFYVLVGLALVAGFVVLALAAQSAGLTQHIQHFARNTLGVKSLSLGPAIAAAAGGAVAAVVAVVGTLLNVLAAVVYNRIADIAGGVSVRLRAGKS